MLALLAAVAVLAPVSVEGRAIRATQVGDPGAPVTVMAVGSIHGDETAGHAVIRALRRRTPPRGVQLWLVTAANPDGVVRGTRQNARGVDLNRNFPYRWRGGGRPGDTYYPGPRAGSEPEGRALRRFIQRVRPDVTVWYHQHLRLVARAPGADPSVVRSYAQRTRLPLRTLPRYRGTATSWQNHHHPGTSAFVVELAAGRLDDRGVARHARAVLAAGRDAARASAAAADDRPSAPKAMPRHRRMP